MMTPCESHRAKHHPSGTDRYGATVERGRPAGVESVGDREIGRSVRIRFDLDLFGIVSQDPERSIGLDVLCERLVGIFHHDTFTGLLPQ